MGRRNDYSGIIAAFVTVGVVLFIGLIISAGKERCISAGCDNEVSSGSSYCYLHKRYSGTSSYKSNSSKYKDSSSSSSSKKTNTTSSGSKSSSKKNTYSNPYSSYDKGYEDVYDGDDYDWDRYYSDDDYADGVDDAMDDLDW
ncbi:MAG: hypothetical protein IJB96_09530 [Lachnospira sp.]|nr:hypothetical protein [Lachnospira sp.]